MSAQSLGSRAIIGTYYKRLNVGPSPWVEAISNLFRSNQASETYKFLGMMPTLRRWIGGRNAKGFRENGITIENLLYESTIEVLVDELRRDKTDQILTRVREHARRANSHWASLLSTLIMNGVSTVCYDGQFFFDTDHSEGDSGSQSNDISVTIADLPVQVAGTTTAPSVEEMQQCIVKGISQILSFVDDQGEPMNEDAQHFLVMVPISLYQVALTATTTVGQVSASQTALEGLKKNGFSIDVVANSRLTWDDSFAVFRTDAELKPLIRQEETPVKVSAKAEGSEFAFDNRKYQYGLEASRNVDYGYWQFACYVTMA